MQHETRFTDEQIASLTQHLMSGWWKGLRLGAVEQLIGVDFEQFERPPQLRFLVAAVNEAELRERAIDSLSRVLRGLNPKMKLDPATLRQLRKSLALARAFLHPDFLIAACDFLLAIEDTDSIRELEKLVERTTLTTYIKREFQRSHGRTEETIVSFTGTPEEERNVRRVRSAAHVACERLKILADEAKRGNGLLRAAHKPMEKDLLKPAASSSSNPDHLLRSETTDTGD